MKRILFFSLMVLAFSLVGCEAFISTPGSTTAPLLPDNLPIIQVDSSATDRFIVSSIEADTSVVRRNTRDVIVEEGYELWLMPVRQSGNEVISYTNVANLKRFVITEEDNYVIPISEFPQDCPSVVFIIGMNDENLPEVKGFLTLKIDESRQVIQFPMRSAMQGDISFGTVSLSDDSYIGISENTLEDNSSGFSSETFASFQNLTILQNLMMSAINILWNTRGSEYYAPHFMLQYELTPDGEVEWQQLELQIYSREYDRNVAIFSPAGHNVMNQNRYYAGYGPQSSVQWSTTIPIQDFLAASEKDALWRLYEENGSQLAAFDLSVAFVLDKNGNPIVPLIDPTYTIDSEDDTLVDQINLNWFYYGSDGETKYEITEGSEIADMISAQSLYMDIYDGETSGTYMLRERGTGGLYGMDGSIFTITDFDIPLRVSDLGNIHVGYRFTFYNCNTPLKASLAR